MKTKEKHKQEGKLLIPLLQFLNVEEFTSAMMIRHPNLVISCLYTTKPQNQKWSYFSQFIVMCNLRSKRLRAVSDQRTGNES